MFNTIKELLSKAVNYIKIATAAVLAVMVKVALYLLPLVSAVMLITSLLASAWALAILYFVALCVHSNNVRRFHKHTVESDFTFLKLMFDVKDTEEEYLKEYLAAS